jgi:hypothetical protein
MRLQSNYHAVPNLTHIYTYFHDFIRSQHGTRRCPTCCLSGRAQLNVDPSGGHFCLPRVLAGWAEDGSHHVDGYYYSILLYCSCLYCH